LTPTGAYRTIEWNDPAAKGEGPMNLFDRSRNEPAGINVAEVEEAPTAPSQAEADIPDSVSSPMQLYLVLFPEEIEEEILQTLEEAGVPGYTEFPKMLGRGRHHRHFGNPVWPGRVGALFTVVSAEQAHAVIEPLRALNHHIDERTKGLHGLHLFVLPCNQVI
jgi:hypothetical protein